jgi:hypothetical protein
LIAKLHKKTGNIKKLGGFFIKKCRVTSIIGIFLGKNAKKTAKFFVGSKNFLKFAPN